MDKATVRRLRAEIAALSPEEQQALKVLTDVIDATIAASLKLDSLLTDITKEKVKKERARIAKEIKEMMVGLLGEDCSTLPTAQPASPPVA